MNLHRLVFCTTLSLVSMALLISETSGQGMMMGKGMPCMGGMMPGMGTMMGKGGMMGMHCSMMGNNGQQKLMECCKKDKNELGEMLKSDKDEDRFTAALAIGVKTLPMTKELIGLLTDKSDSVRQASRRSLIILSYYADAVKKAKQRGVAPRYVDYGPAPNASSTAQKRAAKSWTTWANKNEKALNRLDKQLEPNKTPSSSSSSTGK